MMRLFKPLIFALFAVPVMAQIPAPQINLSGNIGCEGFPCVNSGTLVFTSDADHAMTAQESSAFNIQVTSNLPLTGTRNLVAPLGRFPFTIENATTGGESIQIIGPTGTGVTISNGSTVSVWNDGTNYVQVGVSGGGGTVTTTGSPISPNIAAFSGTTSITAATSANIQTAIGGGVYDASGAAAARAAWPSIAGIPYWASGTSWGGAYNSSTTIPANYLPAALSSSTSVNGTNIPSSSTLVTTTTLDNDTLPASVTSLTINGGTTITSTSSANSQAVTCPTGGSSTQVCDAAGAWISPSGGVTSINSTSGAFTFSFSGGAGSCSGTTCTFTGSGSGGGSVTNFIAGTWISWLTPTVSLSTTTPTLAVAATTGQTSHEVIGTCGTATTFGPCQLVSGDIPSTLTGITIDGVTPTVMGYVDPSSSIQTQLNGKQASLGYVPAHSGANSDITSLSGLTTPLTVAQGGIGTATSGAYTVFGNFTSGTAAPGFTAAPTFSAANLTNFPSTLATSGANSNITSLSGLTTALSAGQGGSGEEGTITGVLYGNLTSAYTAATAAQIQTAAGTTLNRSIIHASFDGGASAAPLGNSQVFGRFVTAYDETITVPSGCTNSTAKAATAATSSTTLTIYNCSAAFGTCSSVGTIAFSGSGSLGTFTCSAGFTVNSGLYIQGPSTADTTLTNIAIGIEGVHN